MIIITQAFIGLRVIAKNNLSLTNRLDEEQECSHIERMNRMNSMKSSPLIVQVYCLKKVTSCGRNAFNTLAISC